MPMTTPETMQMPIAKASATPSTSTGMARALQLRAPSLKVSTSVRARSAPPMPPSVRSTRVSVTICPTSRPRVAPSALRIAISPRRAPARVKRRFATFAQTITKTNATAAKSIQTVLRELPVRPSCRPRRNSPRRVFVAG